MSYYKVVRVRRNGERVSVLAVGKAARVYEPGEWVEAHPEAAKEGYGPLVYTSIGGAEHFRQFRKGEFEIWRCKVEGVKEELPKICTITGHAVLSLGWVRRAWKGTDDSYTFCLKVLEEKIPEFFRAKEGWPDFTVMVERVKLVERVQ